MDLMDCDLSPDHTTNFKPSDSNDVHNDEDCTLLDLYFGPGDSSSTPLTSRTNTKINPPADFIHPESADDIPLTTTDDLRKALQKYVGVCCENVIFDHSLGAVRNIQAMAKLSDHTWTAAPLPTLSADDVLSIHAAEAEYHDNLLHRIRDFVATPAGRAAEAEVAATWDRALAANGVAPPADLLRKAEAFELLRSKLFAQRRGITTTRRFTVTIVKTLGMDGKPGHTITASFPFPASWVEFLDHLRMETVSEQARELGAWEGIGLGLQHGKWYFTSARSPVFTELDEAAYHMLKTAFWENRIHESVVVWHELQTKKSQELQVPSACGSGSGFLHMTADELAAENRVFAELCNYADQVREKIGDWNSPKSKGTLQEQVDLRGSGNEMLRTERGSRSAIESDGQHEKAQQMK